MTIKELQSNLGEFVVFLLDKNYSESTANGYFFGVKSFLDYLRNNDLQIDKITIKDVAEYKDFLIKNNSNQTINSKLFSIRKYFDYINLVYNLNLKFDFEIIKINKKKDFKIININDFNDFINQIKLNNKDRIMVMRDVLIFNFLYFLGIRVKELIKIKKDDFFENELNLGDRKIILNNKLFLDLDEYIKEIKVVNGQYIFFSNNPGRKRNFNAHLTEKSIQDFFNKYKKAISDDLSINDFRKSYALTIKEELLDISITSINSHETVNFSNEYLGLEN